MEDTIIVGAGSAGLTAAIYLSRAGKKIIVFEGNTYGGQIINSLNIENYPGLYHVSGYDYANKLYNQAKDLGAKFIFERVVSIKDQKDYKIVQTNKNTYKAKSLILATGQERRKLNLEGEDKYKNISYCATCDGNFYKGKTVAVIGGGNTAFEDAIYLTDICKKVYLIHRREEFKANPKTVKKLKQKQNVEFILNTNITKLIGKDKLEELELNNKDKLKIDGLFVAIGEAPENEKFKDLINVNDKGYIIASEDCHTNIPGIFVAGDVRTKSLRQLVTATSDGAVAACEAIKYIS